jgi:hypothetical protein
MQLLLTLKVNILRCQALFGLGGRYNRCELKPNEQHIEDEQYVIQTESHANPNLIVGLT